MSFPLRQELFIHGHHSTLSSSSQGKSRRPELGKYGSVQGVPSHGWVADRAWAAGEAGF